MALANMPEKRHASSKYAVKCNYNSMWCDCVRKSGY